MLMPNPKLELALKHFQSLGATVFEQGVQFTVYSRSATDVHLLLYDAPDDTEPVDRINFRTDGERWGDYWRCPVRGIGHGQLYHLQVPGPQRPNRDTGLIPAPA